MKGKFIQKAWGEDAFRHLVSAAFKEMLVNTLFLLKVNKKIKYNLNKYNNYTFISERKKVTYFCKVCNIKLNMESRFCHKCGKPVDKNSFHTGIGEEIEAAACTSSAVGIYQIVRLTIVSGDEIIINEKSDSNAPLSWYKLVDVKVDKGEMLATKFGEKVIYGLIIDVLKHDRNNYGCIITIGDSENNSLSVSKRKKLIESMIETYKPIPINVQRKQTHISEFDYNGFQNETSYNEWLHETEQNLGMFDRSPSDHDDHYE